MRHDDVKSSPYLQRRGKMNIHPNPLAVSMAVVVGRSAGELHVTQPYMPPSLTGVYIFFDDRLTFSLNSTDSP